MSGGDTVEHIDHALVAKPHTSMYLMHKYWARKPHNIINEYIKTYTSEDEIVLDPFCGSGVTPIEAVSLERKAIGTDLNPAAMLISEMTAASVDINEIENKYNWIRSQCEDQIEELYKTTCVECDNRDARILATIRVRGDEAIEEVRYKCNSCDSKYIKDADDRDTRKADSIDQNTIDEWFPTTEFRYNGQEFKEQSRVSNVDTVADLYTGRNLKSMAILNDIIEQIEDIELRKLFKFALSSMSHLATKMCPVADPSGKGHWSKFSATSFWSQHRFYTPPRSMESNVWMLFSSSINGRQGIINGKKDSNSKVPKFDKASTFDDLTTGSNILLKKQDVTEIDEIIPDNSVDYVFTDPPYGGAIQYFELSTLWSSWHRDLPNYSDEITVNKKQGKSFDFYSKLLTACFRKIRRVLKNGRYLTLTFHSTKIKVWNSIIKSVVSAGFDLEKIIYQPPARASSKQHLQPYGSAVGDYYIRFKNPHQETKRESVGGTEQTYERVVIQTAKEIIAHRGEPVMYQHILNGIVPELDKNGVLLQGDVDIEDVMRSHVGSEFELVEIDEDDEGAKWWLANPEELKIERVPLHERVEKSIINTLNREIKVSFDDVLQDIFKSFPNSLTPETKEVRQVLSEYASKESGGKWKLMPTVKRRQSEHSKHIYYLHKIGKSAGYDVTIGQRERRDGHNSVDFETASDALSIDETEYVNKNRVENIDVIWHNDGHIRAAFEVENTTTLTESIVRGRNITGDVPRFVVIPEERQSLISNKVSEPGLVELGIESWNFLFYDDLEEIAATGNADLAKLLELAKVPLDNPDSQSALGDY